MQNFVNGQRSRLTEAFATVGAFKRLLLGMNIPVISQMILSSKCFTTNIARVRTFISVGSLVDEQIVGFGKLSVTKFTNKLLSWSIGSVIYRRFTDVAQSLSYWWRQDGGRGVSRIVVDIMKTFLTGTGGRHVTGSVLEMSGECLNPVWNGGRTVHGGYISAGSFGH